MALGHMEEKRGGGVGWDGKVGGSKRGESVR